MAALTKAEKQLLKSISDQDLHANLLALRRAAERIWSEESPRIIPGYTFHGLSHSQRLIDYATKLLAAHDGSKLTEREMYLLLAGIYLHDIGMQCDVVRWPAIKERATALGAKFDLEISAPMATNYSIDEQKSIRSNHHYLSAAWIDHASRTGETVLGTAAKNIPRELIDDLMDVCKHHTKLPITDCPLTFRRDTNERKQFVAALLRFADELDIDDNRVAIETVKTFNLDPRNSVYWWLHQSTKVIFSARSVVILNIWLHPDDFKEHGPFVHTAFITEFRSKNQPVLTVLGKNGMPIVIGHDSNVEEDDRAEPFPFEIVRALQSLQKPRDPHSDLSKEALAEEVRTWLRAIRYEVSEPKRQNDRVTDMIATLDQGTVKQRVLVRCIDGEIGPGDVDGLDQVLDRKTPQGWLISDKRVSPRAVEKAAEDDAFAVFTLAEFLRQKVWAPYFDALTALVEQARIPELYVDLACYKQDMDEEGQEAGRDRYASLDGYIDSWLSERGKAHISVLGEFGAGKTWFCRHYAYRQLDRYLKDPAGERMPLLITLRAFAKAMTAQQLINDALLEQYKLPFVGGAFEVFQEMNRRGKLLLILDGFDEMARQVDYQTVVDNFWELAKLVEDGSKVILTSRNEYFRWAKETEKVLSGQEYGRRTIVLQPPRFEVLHLEPFTNEQIRAVILGRKGAVEGPAIADRILENENLAEMACKPVLLELLLAALNEVSADLLENQAEVYLYATNALLMRNITAEKTFTTTADKLFFLCELAWEMIKSGELRIHYTTIPERIKSYFGERIKDQHELDTWDYDLRNQTLLHRDAAGYYEFAHKSLAEYFVAFKFAAELGCLASAFIQTYTEANGKPCEIHVEQKEILDLVETFGFMKLSGVRMQEVRGMMMQIISEDYLGDLWRIIHEISDMSHDEVNYIGGNIVTLLKDQGSSFVFADLSRANISGADLSDVDLSSANLSGCLMKEIHVSYLTKMQSLNLDNATVSVDGIETPPYLICVINKEGKFVAVGTSGLLRIYDLESSSIIFEVINVDKSGIFPVFSSNGNDNIIVGGSDKWIKIWAISTNQELFNIEIPGDDSTIVIPVFSLDGRLLAARGKNWMKIWDTITGKEVLSIELPRSVDWKSTPYYMILPSFSANGKWIAACGEEWLRIWNIDSGEESIDIRVTRKSKGVICPSFSPDGRFIAGHSRDWLKVWDLLTFEEVIHIQLPSSQESAICPKFTFSGDRLIGGDSGMLNIWDVSTKDNVLTIQNEHLYVMNMFSVDREDELITGIFSGYNVKIWDLKKGQVRYSVNVQFNCTDMKINKVNIIEGNIGRVPGDSGVGISLLEFFADGGAILDEEQQRTLADLRSKRAEEEQRQVAEEAAQAARPKKPRTRRKQSTDAK